MNDQAVPNQKPAAPRVTRADIEALIAHETYFTAGDGFAGAMSMSPEFMEQPEGNRVIQPPEQLDLLTVCVLIMRNGHTVTGESHCADPAKFDAETGRVEARKRAIDKLYPMVIYAERERLAREVAPTDYRDRVRAEFTELENKLGKLSNFLGSEKFQSLPSVERSLLERQFEAMLAYANVVADRIRNFEADAA